MRIEKKTLNDALRVLGKVVCQTSPVELYRSVRFVGEENGICAMATDGVETVSVILDAFAETEIDFCVPFKELKDLVRMGRSETIELSGKFIEFPELEEPSADAVSAILPVNFGELLAQAASVVDRSNYRRLLQGINLSNAGVTATDGKQLLHLPCVLSLVKDVTIPFPSALLAAKTSEMGVLKIWDTFFQIEIGNFSWHGKLLEGQYPNWRGVIPSPESHDYSITLNEPDKVLDIFIIDRVKCIRTAADVNEQRVIILRHCQIVVTSRTYTSDCRQILVIRRECHQAGETALNKALVDNVSRGNTGLRTAYLNIVYHNCGRTERGEILIHRKSCKRVQIRRYGDLRRILTGCFFNLSSILRRICGFRRSCLRVGRYVI